MAGEKSPYLPEGEIQEFSDKDDLERALGEEVAVFRAGMDDFFGKADSGGESALETATLASFDYYYHDGRIFVLFHDGSVRKPVPINLIVGYLEDSFSKDRDFFSPPHRSEETGGLEKTVIPTSPNLKTASEKEALHLIRRNFVLKPQNGFQRGIEQIRVALNSDLNPEIGEVWVAKRWRMNETNDPLIQTPIDLILPG